MTCPWLGARSSRVGVAWGARGRAGRPNRGPGPAHRVRVPARAASPATALRHARRGIERPRGTFVSGNAAATLGALSPSRAALSFVFGLLEAWGCPRLRASWGVPLRRRRLRGREGLHAGPENQVKQEGAFSAGRVGWGGAGSRGGGAKRLGRAVAGTRRCNPFYWQKQAKKQNDAPKAAFYRARRRPRVTTPAQCCADRRLRQPCAGTPRGSRGNRAKLDALS